MHTETISWHDLPDDGKPDAELSVLLSYLNVDGHKDTWPGWWSGEHWIDATTGDHMERPNEDGQCIRVVAWAHMPEGTPC